MDRLDFSDLGKLALLAVIFGGTLAFAAGAAFAYEPVPIGVDPFINCAELDPIWSSWDEFWWCRTGGGGSYYDHQVYIDFARLGV